MREIDGIEQAIEVLMPHWPAIEEEFNAQNARFCKLAGQDHDLIGRVLRCHLVVENFLTTFLEANFGLEDVDAAKLSFYQKACLLPSKAHGVSWVRPGILQLNSVRNKLGHRLNHDLKHHEISAIYEVLAVARASKTFDQPVHALEAFTPVACAFLSVPPKHLQELFARAFAKVTSQSPS